MSPDSTAADPTMDVDFQKMGIYIDGRTKNELDELLAVKSQSEVTARDLYGFSCMHYLDDEPMNEAASFFGLSRDAPVDADAPPKKILDFGAGFAGDARVMACEFPGSELTCVEVQPHIHAAAERFTALVDASARCKHQCADIFNDPVINGPFDHMFSVLVILHIPERDKLWRSRGHAETRRNRLRRRLLRRQAPHRRGQGPARGARRVPLPPVARGIHADAQGCRLRRYPVGDH